jgi:FlaA1/EpsC-like NDP-sugar epimerase
MNGADLPAPREGDSSRKWKRFLSRRLQVGLDAAALASAFAIAYFLRFDFVVPPEYVRKMLLQAPLVVALQVAALAGCGIYRLIWRYVGLAELKRFVAATAVGAAPMLVTRLVLPADLSDLRVPLSVTLLSTVLGFGAVLGLRVLRRIIYERFERETTAKDRRRERKPVLLVGAGRAGVLAVREIFGRGDVGIEVKGFVDDDLEKVGSFVHDVKVLGTTADIPELVRGLGIDHVVITIAKGSRAEILRIVEICDKVPVKARIIPGLYEILQGKVSTNAIRDVEIEDLLGRDEVRLDAEGLREFLHDRVVMVTGAGGSIGSELVRQAARFAPRRLVLVERAEPLLFQIEQEMQRHFEALDVVAVIGDVGDRERMTDVFATHRPQVVLHAAAHKHVPMMERNPGEAVKNNVFGTLRLGEVAAEAGCETFVLISTDKAVNPASVMGASKRVAELALQSLEDRHRTRYVAVRFGNVLGSTGSVIPIFREQIRRGGPVTVTHPEMTRYFMTIPEAAQLVIQAGALGRGGEIFILDMGKPVKILDVARDMIRLSGLRPDEDIQVRITGLRPGEKLFEELGTTDDHVERTRHPKIFVGKIPRSAPKVVERGLSTLESAVRGGEDDSIRRALRDLVPEASLGNGEEQKEPDPDEVRAGLARTIRQPADAGTETPTLRRAVPGMLAGAR